MAQLGVEPKQLVPLLTETLRRDRDVGVRATALAALAQLGDKAKEAIPAVIQLHKAGTTVGAKDGNDPGDVRFATLTALSKLGVTPKELVPLLTDSAQRDRNPKVRLTAIQMLGEIGPPAKSALPLLVRIQRLTKKATERDKQLATAAAEAAEKIKGKK